MLARKRQLLTMPEVARRLSLNRVTVYRYIREGRLKAVCLPSGIMRIEESELNQFLDTLPEQRYIDELV